MLKIKILKKITYQKKKIKILKNTKKKLKKTSFKDKILLEITKKLLIAFLICNS